MMNWDDYHREEAALTGTTAAAASAVAQTATVDVTAAAPEPAPAIETAPVEATPETNVAVEIDPVFEFTEGLSLEVADAVPLATETVMKLLRQYQGRED